MIKARLFACVTLALAAGQASGAIITFEFGGVITEVDDAASVLPPDVQVGSLFSGSYTFDSTMPDLYPNDPRIGKYDSGADSLAFQIASLPLIESGAGNGYMQVYNDYLSFGDRIDIATVGVQTMDYYIAEFVIGLAEYSGTILSDDSLPLTPPNILVFDSLSMFLHAKGPDNENIVVRGNLTYFIPEPTTLILAMFALFLRFPRRRYS